MKGSSPSSSSRRTSSILAQTPLEKFLKMVLSPAIRGQSCPICLTRLDERRAAVITACKHAYGIDCIDKWSRLKRSCPLCNAHFDSWFFNFNLSASTYRRHQLPSLQQGKRQIPQSGSGPIHRHRRTLISSRVFQRSREELNRASWRERPLPWRRSFGRPGEMPPRVTAEKKLHWRASIYRRGLQAVPVSCRSYLEQHTSRENGARDRILETVEPWIRRELQAILGDPDPSVIVHVATSLFIGSLEGKFNASSGQIDVESDFLAPLRPFLDNHTKLFWHELRCFAESSLTMEAYDSVAEYRQLD